MDMSAEFLGWKHQQPGQAGEPPAAVKHDEGFGAMGHPVPAYRQQAGYDLCRQLGCGTEAAWTAVAGMAGALERDKPYEAMEAGMRTLDLTGTYRLMAVLLSAIKPRFKIRAATKKREE
jgi:hypothetical protein